MAPPHRLCPITDSLQTCLVPECGRVVQKEQPAQLSHLLLAFLPADH